MTTVTFVTPLAVVAREQNSLFLHGQHIAAGSRGTPHPSNRSIVTIDTQELRTAKGRE